MNDRKRDPSLYVFLHTCVGAYIYIYIDNVQKEVHIYSEGKDACKVNAMQGDMQEQEVLRHDWIRLGPTHYGVPAH